MVKQIDKNKKTYYLCQECNFAYLDRKIADECEKYCKKYHSCNLEITKHAVEI